MLSVDGKPTQNANRHGSTHCKSLTLMAYNVIARHNSLQINGPNITNPCLFDHEASNGAMNTSFNYRWITIPDFLSTVSLTMLYIITHNSANKVHLTSPNVAPVLYK